ncbi:MAG TPA: hypothetical protein VM889_11430 [Candidatus Thermoplasmatota archaeon]|nr:hypothetical protein [Candidatus Thermoplasmatota archaeon]
MAEAPGTTPHARLPDEHREKLAKALQDGLAGRKALMRAYEMVSERVSDPAAKSTLKRFAQEEKEEYEAGAEITRRYGGDPGGVTNIKNEVVAFLGKGIFMSGEKPYADARDFAILCGMESAGHVAANAMKPVAERVGDPAWKTAVEQSITRAESHIEYLRNRAIEAGNQAIPGPGPGSYGP